MTRCQANGEASVEAAAYAAARDVAKAGVGETVRGAQDNSDVAQELGPTGNTTTTWFRSQRQVHQVTGDQAQSWGEVRRDLNQ